MCLLLCWQSYQAPDPLVPELGVIDSNGSSGELEKTVRGMYISGLTVKQDSYCWCQEGTVEVAEKEHE